MVETFTLMNDVFLVDWDFFRRGKADIFLVRYCFLIGLKLFPVS